MYLGTRFGSEGLGWAIDLGSGGVPCRPDQQVLVHRIQTVNDRIGIVGDGQMGLVLADALVQRGAEVSMWGPFPETVDRLASTRENPDRLSGFRLPEGVRVSSDQKTVLAGTTVIINAIPSQFIRSVWNRIAGEVPEGCAIVNVAKGIENDTLARPSEVLLEVVPQISGVCALSGPTIATELATRLPAVMVSAAEQATLAETVQSCFDVSWMRVYTSTDLIGVELAGACKNVIALAAGMCDGLSIGDNAKSAVLARGLAEITRLGEAMGAQMDTFFGVAGVGDLATTCFSPHGRNRSCGEALGAGMSLSEYEASTSSVVEGVATSRSIRSLAKKHDVEMPIAETVYDVLFNGLDPLQGVSQLMQRESGRE